MITFQELHLNDSILRAITDLGFEHPTEIQQKAIPVFLQQQQDLIALAQTGTGKTASFGLPLLHHIDTSAFFTQALIIAPTRELCLQITNDLKNYAKYLPSVKIVAVYGGSSIVMQIKELKRGAHIVVATPGRLIDLLDRKAVRIDQVKTVVLDEADEMLNMGFQEDMEVILSQTPSDKITGLFSATMPKEIRQITKKYLNNPTEVSIGKVNAASSSITHQYAVIHAKDKLVALKRIIDYYPDFFGIVFCTTRLETQEISDTLVKAGYNADCLHGDLSQMQRDTVMGKFRKRTINILCATDVAARGIDVKDISHVIHYHLPDDIENYTHRSGRTARAGKTGVSIALLHIREAYKLHQIEKTAGIKFEKYTIPTAEKIIAKNMDMFVSRCVEEIAQSESIELPMDNWKEMLMQLEKEDLVNWVLSNQFKRFDKPHYQLGDINVNEKEKRGKSDAGQYREERKGAYSNGRSKDGGRRHHSDASVRLFINLGKKDNIRYDEMRELLYKQSKVSGFKIKDIEMKGVYSFFQTDEHSARQLLDSFKQVNAYGRQVRIQEAEKQKY